MDTAGSRNRDVETASVSGQGSPADLSRFRSALYSFFRRQGFQRFDCEDYVQDVYLRTIKSVNLCCTENANAYLFKIAWSVLKDYGRRSKARRIRAHVALESVSDFHLGVSPSPDWHLEQQQTLKIVSAQLGSLPYVTREVFMLRRVERVETKVVARQLGISVRQVRLHVDKGRKRLMMAFSSPETGLKSGRSSRAT